MTYLPPDPQNSAVPGAQMPPTGGQVPPAEMPQAPLPYAPVPPPQPPHRGGLPAWAWVVLGVVAALFIGLIVAMAILIPRVVGQITADVRPTPIAPAPTEGPDLDDSLEGMRYTLDDQITLNAGPFWGVEFEDDWSIDVWDTDGVNQLSHAASGCKLYTFQGAGVPDAASSPTDRVATELTIPSALKLGLPWEATGDPEVQPSGSLDLDLDFGPDEVEMQQLRAEYTGTDGAARERVILLRAFLPTNNVLLAQVDCPAGAPELAERLDDLAISQY